ncbi:hypothetical protein BHC44_09565 [Snodgrassella alvi]|nr:hypothetical protein BHC44_09565 [Snodgrassella alvi]
MYAVFGKSIKKEEQRKGDIANKLSPSDRYYSNNNAYQISPDYSSLERCYEFIELAKKTHDVRCIYIAQAEKVTVNGRSPKISKKTGKPLFRFVKLIAI